MIEYNNIAQSTQKQGGKAPAGTYYSTVNHNNDSGHEDDEMAKYQSRKIGPFSFDIDDEIDTEVLTSEEVYKDLKELEGILDKESDKINLSSKMLGRSKKNK
jgi:hypothetical protein